MQHAPQGLRRERRAGMCLRDRVGSHLLQVVIDTIFETSDFKSPTIGYRLRATRRELFFFWRCQKRWTEPLESLVLVVSNCLRSYQKNS